MANETSFQQEERFPFNIHPFGDSAVVLRFNNLVSPEINRRIRGIASYLEEHPFRGIVEIVPAYCTLTIYYDPWVLSEKGKFAAYGRVQDYLKEITDKTAFNLHEQPAATVKIPVCYGGRYGPDLAEVAQVCGLSPQEVIAVHSAPEYLVYMMGFVPGFPYLGGMDARIETPRKRVPRPKIPAGSVGIAGKQTGLYPLETPGGWQLIGRTPLRLFDPKRKAPALLQAGDSVRFVPVSEEEYLERKAEG